MSKTVAVKIGGKEMNLRCEDETTLLRAASQVDSIITQLQQRAPDQTTATLSVLAALNIAEKSDEIVQQHHYDKQYVFNELSAMTSHLEESCSRLAR